MAYSGIGLLNGGSGVDYGGQHRSRGVHRTAEKAVRVAVSTSRVLVVILRED
jgi:hypothetical protein